MAKEKITIKQAKGVVKYGVGYCKLQFLFDDLTPWAYVATNTYGWRCDIYNVDGVQFSMGYSPVGMRIDYEITSHYEELAQKVVYENHEFEKRREKLQELRQELLKELAKLEK